MSNVFRSMVAPKAKGSPSKSKKSLSSRIVKLNLLLKALFQPTTLMVLGATVQSILVLVIPRFYAFLPSVLILSYLFADTLLITFKLKPNPYLADSIFKKYSAVLPSATTGELPTPKSASSQKVAVLLLGFKVNHPLGFFAPHVKMVGDLGGKMYAQLEAERATNGFLGQSAWSTTDSRGIDEMMLVSYWRSKDDIIAYSQSELHLDAWKWWDAQSRKQKGSLQHIGINHEIFESDAGQWESVYINQQPSRLAGTKFLRKMADGQEEWVSPVVRATGVLGNSHGRSTWALNATPKNDQVDDEKERLMAEDNEKGWDRSESEDEYGHKLGSV